MKSTPAFWLFVCWLTSTAWQSAWANDLKCYKIKDPQEKTKYTADLTGIAVEPGCVIKVPAKMACVPATTRNITPTPPGLQNSETSKGLACYKVKCPKQPSAGILLDDRFGDRTVASAAASLLCVPVTTSIFSCGDGPAPQCGGTCPAGQVCESIRVLSEPTPGICSGPATCQCVDPATACLGQPCPSRLCLISTCIFGPGSGCDPCGRSGALCETADDCCCQSCSPHQVGAAGECQGDPGDPGCP